TKQENDVTLYDRPDQPDWSFDVTVSDDGRWLQLYVSSSKAEWTQNLLFVRDLSKKKASWIPLVDKFGEKAWIIGSIGSPFDVFSDRQASRAGLLSVDAAGPGRWDEVVPETTATLRGASIIHDQLVLQYLEDAHSRVAIHDLKGKKLRDVPL